MPEPGAPGPGELLIRVSKAALCGTDSAEWDHGPLLARPPVMLGHEFTGTVIAAGPEHGRFPAGDQGGQRGRDLVRDVRVVRGGPDQPVRPLPDPRPAPRRRSGRAGPVARRPSAARCRTASMTRAPSWPSRWRSRCTPPGAARSGPGGPAPSSGPAASARSSSPRRPRSAPARSSRSTSPTAGWPRRRPWARPAPRTPDETMPLGVVRRRHRGAGRARRHRGVRGPGQPGGGAGHGPPGR